MTPSSLIPQWSYSRILNNRIYTGIYFEKIFRPIRPYLSLYAYLKFTIPPYTDFIQVYTFPEQ